MTPESTRGRPGEWAAGESDAPSPQEREAEAASAPISGVTRAWDAPPDAPAKGTRRSVSGKGAPGPAQPIGRRVRGVCVRMLLGGLIGVSRALPMPWAERFGSALGDLIFWCMPRYRALALRN